MGRIIVNKDHDAVTVVSNTANEFSTIFKVKIPAKTIFVLQSGYPIRMRLKDSGGTELPDAAEVQIGWEKPNGKGMNVLDSFQYRVFKALTDAQQLDENTRRRYEVTTQSRALGLRSDYQIFVKVKSSAVVVWANSYLELEVEELTVS